MKWLLLQALRKHTIMAGVSTSSQPYNECFKVRDPQYWRIGGWGGTLWDLTGRYLQEPHQILYDFVVPGCVWDTTPHLSVNLSIYPWLNWGLEDPTGGFSGRCNRSISSASSEVRVNYHSETAQVLGTCGPPGGSLNMNWRIQRLPEPQQMWQASG